MINSIRYIKKDVLSMRRNKNKSGNYIDIFADYAI